MAYKSTGPIDCSIKLDTSNLKGRTAIVTGGASGIGLAYVRKLIEAGAYVVIADVNEEGGKKVQEEMGKAAVFVKCDVCKWSDQLAVFKQAIELSPEGQIDIGMLIFEFSDGLKRPKVSQSPPTRVLLPTTC